MENADANRIIQNRLEFPIMTSPNHFSQSAFRLLLKKIREACRAKGVDNLDGVSPDEFVQIMETRLSQNEPLIRLIFRCMFAIINANIFFAEVCNEDPALLISAFQQGDLGIFYSVYPNNTITQTADATTAQMA
jgi:hypothetical protein